MRNRRRNSRGDRSAAQLTYQRYAVEKTRTSTGFPPQAPQACASTISPRPHRVASGTLAAGGRAYSRWTSRVNRTSQPVAIPPTRSNGNIDDALQDYDEALATMQARVAAIRAGTAPELVWLLEHPPLYTAGTSARPADLIGPQPASPPTTPAAAANGPITAPASASPTCMLNLAQPHRDIRATARTSAASSKVSRNGSSKPSTTSTSAATAAPAASASG